jgi:hypothetical protein
VEPRLTTIAAPLVSLGRRRSPGWWGGRNRLVNSWSRSRCRRDWCSAARPAPTAAEPGSRGRVDVGVQQLELLADEVDEVAVRSQSGIQCGEYVADGVGA